ncbi:AAA family ATPase [Erysipelothrix sp. D19-032]
MLQHLAIKNYILIQDISVDLSDNFNVFTGETGSGKSMLVDALNFAFGRRSSASIVGKYDNVSRVEVIFTVADNHPVIPYLEEIGFDVDPSDPIIISRDMNRDGKSNARINHRIVTTSLLRELARISH